MIPIQAKISIAIGFAKTDLCRPCWIASMVVVGLLGSIHSPVPAQTQVVPTMNPLISQRPAPPRTPPPNNTRSGGSLGEGEICQNSSHSIVALVPETNPIVTTSAYPTFFVYVPFAATDVEFGEFSVLVGLDETTQLYRTRFALPQTPGIVSISLPNSPDTALKEGIFYHWYFKLHCKGNTTAAANMEVSAWVQRVSSTETNARQIEAFSPDFWYDSLTQLAARLQAAPQDPELHAQWSKLLKVIQAESLEQVLLVGAVQLAEN